MKDRDIHAQCCFCGNAIVRIEPDPLTLKLAIEEGGEQQLFCHYRCLKRVLDPSVALYPFEPANR
jgi:hypothetical protein